MKKLSRIIVCFILVIALVLSTAACKPTKPTPEKTPTPTPVVTATPTPEKTPTPVTPTPTPTKTPGGSSGEITFPDGWDKPTVSNKIDASAIGALTGSGTYEVNAINAAVDTEIKNDNFSGKLIFNAINVGTSALTITTPKATVEMKGAVKCGAFNVKTSDNTFIVNGIVIEADNIVIDGGNILLMEGTKVVGTIAIPASNTTTTKIEITGAETQSITILDSTNPIDVTVKGASDVSIDNQSTKPTTIAVEGSAKTAIKNAANSTIGVTVKGDSKTTVDNAGTSTVNVDGNSQVAVDNKATGTVAVEVGATATPAIKMENANVAADSTSIKIPATSNPTVDLGTGTNAPTIKDENGATAKTETFTAYETLASNANTVFVGATEQVVVYGGKTYKGIPTIKTIAAGITAVTETKINLKILGGTYKSDGGFTISKSINISGVGDATIIDAAKNYAFIINGNANIPFKVSISNLKIINANEAISLGAAKTSGLKNATISGVNFESFSSKGIYLAGASGTVKVENCKFDGIVLDPQGFPTQQRSGSGIDVDLNGDDTKTVKVTLKITNNTFKNFQNSGSTSGAIKLKNRGGNNETAYGKIQSELTAILSGNTYTNNNRDLVIGTSGILSTYPKSLDTTNDKNLTKEKIYNFAEFGKTKVTTSEELVKILGAEAKYRKNVTIDEKTTEITLTENATIQAGTTLTIPAGKTLTIAAGKTLTNNGTIVNNGTLVNNGTIVVNDGKSLLVALAANQASGIVEFGRDIKFAESYAPLYMITGTLDGKGHTLSGLEQLIDTKGFALAEWTNGDTVIKNLNIDPKTTKAQGVLPLIGSSWGNSMTFDNVNINNGIVEMASGDNNESAYMSFAGAKTTKFANCTNNLSYISTVADMYSSAFLGGYVTNKDEGRQIIFTKCINNGNISMTSASVFIGNFTNLTADIITLENCQNNGIIEGTEAVAYFGASNKGDDVTKAIRQKELDLVNSKAITGSGSLVSLKLDGLTLKNVNGKMEITTPTTPIDGAVYKLSYSAYARSTKNGTSLCNLIFDIKTPAVDGKITTEHPAYVMKDRTRYDIANSSAPSGDSDWLDMGVCNYKYKIIGNTIIVDFSTSSDPDYVTGAVLDNDAPAIAVTVSKDGKLLGKANLTK